MLVVCLILFFSFVTPEDIVANIGINGAYAIVFLSSLFGVSSFISASFYTTLIMFASSGEFNPFLLGVVAVPGRVLGDVIFFYLGLHGRKVSSKILQALLKDFSSWMKKISIWIPLLTTYFYTAFTPLPHDFLMFVLGLGGISFRKVIPFLIAGNATFIFFIVYFSKLFS